MTKRTQKQPLLTVRHYDLFEVVSALQKAIRRGDARIAGYFAIELHESGYGGFLWRRLLTCAAEDCHGIISQELQALHQSWLTVRAANPEGTSVFVARAVILLSYALKNRDADHLACLVYNRKVGIDDAEILKALEEARSEAVPIPSYALDVHTLKGKRRGRSKDEFFATEFDALQPRIRGLFDDVVETYRRQKKER